MSTSIRKLEVSLLALRLGVATVMLVWVVDKFVRPGHLTQILEGLYGVSGVGEAIVMGVGICQLLLVLAFLAGVAKTWTYGAILLLHAASTFVAWRLYLAPFEGSNILFFAAWPMLAACLALFLMREQDRLWAIDKAQRPVFPGGAA
jgi:putative oxidoreductase